MWWLCFYSRDPYSPSVLKGPHFFSLHINALSFMFFIFLQRSISFEKKIPVSFLHILYLLHFTYFKPIFNFMNLKCLMCECKFSHSLCLYYRQRGVFRSISCISIFSSCYLHRSSLIRFSPFSWQATCPEVSPRRATISSMFCWQFSRIINSSSSNLTHSNKPNPFFITPIWLMNLQNCV